MTSGVYQETTLAYDGHGRLASRKLPIESSATVFEYNGDDPIGQGGGMNANVGYDGDDQRVKWEEGGVTTWYVRSSVIGGQVVSEVNVSGQKVRGYIYAGGRKLAKQEGSQTLYDHVDPATTSVRMTNSTGGESSRVELDPLGVKTGFSATQPPPSAIGFYGDPQDPGMGCRIDGLPAPCSMALRLLRSGAAVPCPPGGCGPIAATNRNTGGRRRGGPPVLGGYNGNPSHRLNPNWNSGTDSGETSLPTSSISFLALLALMSQQNQTIINITYLGDAKYKSVTSRRPEIEGILYGFLKLQKCLDAFTALGIDLKALLSTGLVIGPAFFLTQQSGYSAQQLGLTQTALNQARAQGTIKDAITTTSPAALFSTAPNNVIPDPRPRMFLGTDTTDGGYNNLKEVLSHELIHAGGYPPVPPSLWQKALGFPDVVSGGRGAQDLDHLGAKYKAVMKECGEAPTPP